MIKIKISEFKISAQDLDQSRTLFLQTKSFIYPVTSLKADFPNLILETNSSHHNLTLHQFKKITVQFNENLSLATQNGQIILGYRLENNQIIFG